MAMMWLMPRMGSFWRAHPDIVVDHLISDQPRDYKRADVELRIRYGFGVWPDETSQLLLTEILQEHWAQADYRYKLQGKWLRAMLTQWQPLRVSAWHGPNNQRSRKPGLPGEQIMDYGAIDLKKGGSAIPYCEEDPHLRQEFDERLKAEGLASRMKPEFYTDPGAGDVLGNVM